jgi:hypothetical protein
MWGSKKDQPEEDLDEAQPQPLPASQNDGASSRRSYNPYDRREPDERTRLLNDHRPVHNDGYLSPDDPAVSLCIFFLRDDANMS